MVEKKGYGQFCPIALAAEILAERWMPLVIREGRNDDRDDRHAHDAFARTPLRRDRGLSMAGCFDGPQDHKGLSDHPVQRVQRAAGLTGSLGPPGPPGLRIPDGAGGGVALCLRQ